jgi:hypothetical protein
MHFAPLALYAGPDQVMTVTSGLASLLGLLLISWNKVVAAFFRVVRVFHCADPTPSGAPAKATAKAEAPKDTTKGSS